MANMAEIIHPIAHVNGAKIPILAYRRTAIKNAMPEYLRVSCKNIMATATKISNANNVYIAEVLA